MSYDSFSRAQKARDIADGPTCLVEFPANSKTVILMDYSTVTLDGIRHSLEVQLQGLHLTEREFDKDNLDSS